MGNGNNVDVREIIPLFAGQNYEKKF